jgi:DNA uptake protein ComE-like DNA-binding protein
MPRPTNVNGSVRCEIVQPAARNDADADALLRQRVLSAMLLIALALGALGLRGAVPPPHAPAPGAHIADATLALDPNVAPWWELTVLEGIGPQRAKAIVAYRDLERDPERPDNPVFRSAAYLERVPGIGPKTVEVIRAQLVFTEQTTSAP